MEMEMDKRNWNISPFIQKLEQMLGDTENHSIIRFDLGSKKIEISSKKEMETILPKYYRHGHFESFVRQLNWYGFHKVNNRSLHCYEHPDLEKGFHFSNIRSRRPPAKKSKSSPPQSPPEENRIDTTLPKTPAVQISAVSTTNIFARNLSDGTSRTCQGSPQNSCFPIFSFFHPNQMLAPQVFFNPFQLMQNYF